MATNMRSLNKNILNNKTQQLKREIQKLKKESINSYVKNLSAKESTKYSLWKATKKLRRPINHAPPIRKENGI